MRSKLVMTSIIAGSLFVGINSATAQTPRRAPAAAPAPAANGQFPPKVEKALHDNLLGYTWKSAGTRNINGVTVYDVTISNQLGESTATITDEGDFLVSGVPTADDRIAGPVKAVINQLFKTPPKEVDRVHVTTFPVDITANGQNMRIIFDAVGRVREVRGETQLHAEDAFDRSKDITNADSRRRAMDAIKRNSGDEPQIEHMYAVPGVENFHYVEFKNAKGKTVTVVTNGNEVFSHKVQITEAELPQPVKNSLHTLFKADTVTSAARRRYEYYSIEEVDQNNDVVTMKIASDGVVMSAISNSAREEEAAATRRQHNLEVGHQPGGL